MTDLLIGRGLTKRFGDKHALRGFDVTVGPGEIVGFIGPNGAGKSTCLRLCVGLCRRNSGRLSVFGIDPAIDSVAIRKRCAYLPGEFSVYHQMTGRDFLRFARHGYESDSEIEDLGTELFDLPLRQKIRSYSAGMKQRLALRAILPLQVELLILDEPDRALDASARMQLQDLFSVQRERGRSILLSSHHLSEVDSIADRNLFVLDGTNVDEQRLQSARDQLRSEIRLQLRTDTPLPDGTAAVERTPNGSYRIRTIGDPIPWLARIPSEQIESAEVGATRLEDVYRVLMQSEPVHGS